MAATELPAGASTAATIGPASSAAAVAAWITAQGKSGPEFLTWYAGAKKNDPSLTPFQGAQVWLIGSSLSTAIGDAAVATGQATGQAGKGTAAGLAKLYPNWSLVFGNVTGLLTRILKVGFGALLIVAGILQLSGADKTLEQVVPLVGGPAGRLLHA